MTLFRGFYTHWHVYLWQNGVIYEKKRRLQVFRWNQVESVNGNAMYMIVLCQDNRKIKFGYAFIDFPELVSVVQEEVTRRFAPHDLKILPPGSAKAFLGSKVDQRGIHSGQEHLPWESLDEFTTQNGTIIVTLKGSASDFPEERLD